MIVLVLLFFIFLSAFVMLTVRVYTLAGVDVERHGPRYTERMIAEWEGENTARAWRIHLLETALTTALIASLAAILVELFGAPA